MMTEIIDPQDYKDMLRHHDWFYYMSDDHRVYLAGERASKKIFDIAVNGTDEHRRAYNEAHALRFNTPTFVTPDHPYRIPFAGV